VHRLAIKDAEKFVVKKVVVDLQSGDNDNAVEGENFKIKYEFFNIIHNIFYVYFIYLFLSTYLFYLFTSTQYLIYVHRLFHCSAAYPIVFSTAACFIAALVLSLFILSSISIQSLGTNSQNSSSSTTFTTAI